MVNQDEPDTPRSAPDTPRGSLVGAPGPTQSPGSASGSDSGGPTQTIGSGPAQTIGDAPATGNPRTGWLVGGAVALLVVLAIIIGFVAR